MPQIKNKEDRLNCRCTRESETITPLEQNGDGHVWCEINKNYPFSGKCFVSMATHLQFSFMKVILFANEASPTTVGLERRDGSFCFDCALYFYILNNCLCSVSWIQSGGCDIWNCVSKRMGGVACRGVGGVLGRE